MNANPLPAACSESEALRILNWSPRRTDELRRTVPSVPLQRGRIYPRDQVQVLASREAAGLANRAVGTGFVTPPLHTR